MAPARKSRSVNKRFSYGNEVSPTKDGDNTNKKNQRKKKLSDMLGVHWSKEELEHFYEAYRKHGRDWRKVAAVLRSRSVEMVEAVYSLNKAYLSLPEGTASVAGFIAMMTDYYSNMEERDSEQEGNDGVGTSRKPQKRVPRKVHETTSKGSVDRFQSASVPSDYGFLSLLKKKRSGGSRPRVVGKRTPRFPVSHSYEKVKGEKFYSQTKKPLKLRSEKDEDVAHNIAMTLAEASKRGGSPQDSHTPNRRSDSPMSSPCQSSERVYDESDVGSGWFVDNDMHDDDIEGSMEADNTDFSRDKSKERVNAGYTIRKVRADKKENKQLEYIREACSGTEGQNLGTIRRNIDVEVADAKPHLLKKRIKEARTGTIGRNFDVEGSDAKPHIFKKRSKEARTGRVENSDFDALETLANLSLMILPESNGNDSIIQANEGKTKLVDGSRLPLVMPASRHREKRKSSALTGKGKQCISRIEAADDKPQTSGKGLVVDTSEAKEAHQLITKVTRKRQKIVAPKISEAEVPIDMTPKESHEAEVTHAQQMSMSRRISQSSSPQLVKSSQYLSSTRREVDRTSLSDSYVSETNACNRHTRNKRKMYKPQALDISKFSDVGTEKSSVSSASLSNREANLKGKLFNCLSNQLMRRWCALEWLYSAIDDPWFAKKEFVEYLYHVGLGHVPRLTRVEWGVIRSSLGKPRRFSDQFLKEEVEKLNQYRDSVRTHYTELRSGTRDGLPTDLARPLAVGQHVIAIHPRTREIHDGTVLTVDHDRCRVQFDRPELGVEIIMDTDCMPLNPFENLPSALMHRMPVEKFFQSLNEVKVNGLGKDPRLEGYTRCSSDDKSENMDEVASVVKSEFQSRNGSRDALSNHHHAPYSVPATPAQIQAKEADVEAIAELTRALDKKEAVVFELRRMNDDVLQNQAEGDFALQDSDAFKKQYAAVLVQLNEANSQVSSALFHLRQRNTYQHNYHLNLPKPVVELTDHGTISSSSDHTTTNQTQDSESHVNEIVGISRTKARQMVEIAIQAMSSLKLNPTVEIDKAVDYVNDRLVFDDSYIPTARTNPVAPYPVKPSDSNPMKNPSNLNKPSLPSENLITHCVATLFIIQKCTEREFPPAEVASILDSALSSLQPCSPQNLQVYADIQKCMGIIKNQILALVPT